MFCKYCGKNAGDNDICADCMKKTVNADISRDTGDKSNTPSVQLDKTEGTEAAARIQDKKGSVGYKKDALPGFRTNTTWKKVIVGIYYAIVAIYVLNLYGHNWYSALTMLTVLWLPVSIMGDLTNREGTLHVKLRDKPFIMKFLWGIGSSIISVILAVIFIEILIYMEENSYNFIDLFNVWFDALYN